MKICFIIPHFFPHIGGAEKLFYDFSKIILENNHEVRIITCNSGGITGYHFYENLPVYYYPWRILMGHPIPKKKDLIDHIKWADIIHTTIYTTAIPSYKISRKMDKPVVFTLHEYLGKKWFWVEKNKIKALAFLIFEYIVCHPNYSICHAISNATKNNYLEVYKNRSKQVAVVYPAVSNPDSVKDKAIVNTIYKHFNILNNNIIFLFYGRPGKTKGIFIYADAIKILKQQFNSIDLSKIKFCFIMADDPLKQKQLFIKKIQKYLLKDFVLIKSSVPRQTLMRYIKESDYVVIPSITEGFGLSAAEACILNKKIIYSDGGSLPEVVSGNCLSFRNRDAHDLSLKIKSVIENGDRAFNSIPKKEFLYTDLSRNLMKLYNNILNEKKLR